MHDFEVIEIAGQTALFTNDRLMPADIPKGTYCYGLRQSDDSERFCTIEKNVGIVSVPDERLDKLAEMYEPDKFTPATLEFVDIDNTKLHIYSPLVV